MRARPWTSEHEATEAEERLWKQPEEELESSASEREEGQQAIRDLPEGRWAWAGEAWVEDERGERERDE